MENVRKQSAIVNLEHDAGFVHQPAQFPKNEAGLLSKERIEDGVDQARVQMARMFFDEDMVHDAEMREQVGQIDSILQAIEAYDLPLAGGNVAGVAVSVFDVALYLLALQESVDKKTTELPFLGAEFVQLDLVSV